MSCRVMNAKKKTNKKASIAILQIFESSFDEMTYINNITELLYYLNNKYGNFYPMMTQSLQKRTDFTNIKAYSIYFLIKVNGQT